MANLKYKYDVAFSFLQEDESLATQVNDLLQDRMSTFLYTEHQKEIAGKDGEKEFNSVFGADSRIVVVFYRKNWGQTKWTRIEETAIRNRAFEEGYDFVTFIALDPRARVPKWLPKTRLYVGFDHWGIDGAASVIEARVQEAGGTHREETVEDHAARISREIGRSKERDKFLKSDKGVEAANEEAKKLFLELEKICKSVTNPEANIKFEIQQRNRKLCIFSNGLTLSHHLYLRYSNTLDESALYVTLWRGMVGFPNVIHWEKPNKLKEFILHFNVINTTNFGWQDGSSKNRFFSSAQLAQFSMKIFLDEIRDEQIKKQR